MLLEELPLVSTAFKPTHVSSWFKPSWISTRVLKDPVWHEGRLERGAMILNQVDPLVGLFPELRSLYILIERHGWFGPNESGCADIAFVEDLGVWDRLCARDPDIIHLPLGGADFVDVSAFRPLPTNPDYDVIQISCWSRRKRIELFIEAAAKLPHLSFVHLGHFENSGSPEELKYRDECIALAARLGANVAFPFGHAKSNTDIPHRKAELNAWLNRARLGVLSAEPEGINRFKMECLAADRPMLVAADAGGPTTKHINSQTGLLFEPSPDRLAESIRRALSNIVAFQPRAYLLAHTGRHCSLGKLRSALRESCDRTGGRYHFDDIDWDGRNESLAWGREGVAVIVEALQRQGGSAPAGIMEQLFPSA